VIIFTITITIFTITITTSVRLLSDFNETVRKLMWSLNFFYTQLEKNGTGSCFVIHSYSHIKAAALRDGFY
jgi:hypothetical protein